ncbi:MAG: Uma2 family endonuclease [Myxococcales bacterium]|nr:Uma2 family endonuclease [Myxococcales bacterium]
MAEPASRMSYVEYLAFEAGAETKHEYADGLVFAMAGGTLEHARLSGRLAFLLGSALEGRPCNVLSSDARVRVEATNRTTYPDLSVVCGRLEHAKDDPHALVNPAVIVEVLSEGTERGDRGEKFRHYRRLPSLKEYVLVAQDEPRVEVFRREADVWTFREHGPGDRVTLTSVDAWFDIDALYADPARSG